MPAAFAPPETSKLPTSMFSRSPVEDVPALPAAKMPVAVPFPPELTFMSVIDKFLPPSVSWMPAASVLPFTVIELAVSSRFTLFA